jgi:hypothetical protein
MAASAAVVQKAALAAAANRILDLMLSPSLVARVDCLGEDSRTEDAHVNAARTVNVDAADFDGRRGSGICL